MLRLNDALKIFKISKPTFYKWIKDGCPVHYVGSIPYFDIEEINEWIKKEKRGE